MNAQSSNEEERLLSSSRQRISLVNLNSAQKASSPTRMDGEYSDEINTGISGTDSSRQGSIEGSENNVEYKVYKRRWLGLIQLVLLNIIESWGVRIEHSVLMKQVHG